MRRSFVYVFEARHFRPATNIYRYRTSEIFSCLYIRPTTLVHCYFPFSIDFCSSLQHTTTWHGTTWLWSHFPPPEIIAVIWLFLARSLRKVKGVEEEA